MLPLKEEDILDAYKRVMSRLAGDVSEVIQAVKEIIESELSPSQTETVAKYEEDINMYQKRIIELFKQKREGNIRQIEYDKDYKECSELIMRLQEKQAAQKEQTLVAYMSQQRLEEITEILSNWKIDEIDESIMKMLIDCIKVVSKNEIEFQLKCGISVTEKL